jgi:hypothetical protein
LQLHLGGAPNITQYADNLSRLLIELVQVIAENIDCDQSFVAGQSLVDPLRQKSVGCQLWSRKLRDGILDARLCGLHLIAVAGDACATPAARLQIHINFAFMGAPR